MHRLYLLNAKATTVEELKRGLPDHQVERLSSKQMILHLTADGRSEFIQHGEIVDFTDSYVFTRLAGKDETFCGMLYEHLNAHGIPASDQINGSFADASSKLNQMARFQRAGIGIPETILAREEGYATQKDYILNALHFPLIYKLSGSQGRDVHYVADVETLEQLISQKEPYRRFMLQPFIPNTFDTRTLVAYGEVLGTIKRTRTQGHLNNVSQGAHAEAYELTAAEAAVAIHATTVAGLDFGGVDLIHTDGKPIVLEVNKSPQIKGFEQVFGTGYVFTQISTILKERVL